MRLEVIVQCSHTIGMIESRKMRWAGYVARMGEKKTYRVLVGKLGGSRSWYGNNIKMNVRDRRRGGMDWINVIQDRDQWRALVDMVMNLRVL
jgi:hypothetical protein